MQPWEEDWSGQKDQSGAAKMPWEEDWAKPQQSSVFSNVGDAIHSVAKAMPSLADLPSVANIPPVARAVDATMRGAAEGFGDRSLGLSQDQVKDFERLGLPPELNRAALALVQTFAIPIDAAARIASAAFTGGAAGLKQLGMPDDIIGLVEYELTKGEVAMRGSPRIGELDAAAVKASKEEAAGAFSGATAQAYNKPLALPAPDAANRAPTVVETPKRTIIVEEEPVTAEVSRETRARAAPPEAVDDWFTPEEVSAESGKVEQLSGNSGQLPSAPVEKINTTNELAKSDVGEITSNNANNPSPTIPTDVKVIRRSPRKPPSFSNENSVMTNIIAMGGVKTRDAAGNLTKEGQDFLASMKDIRRPGLVNNKTGMAPDRIRDAFRQQGWFGSREDRGQDMQDLYDLVDTEARGQRAYHPESEQGVQAAGQKVVDENADALADIKDRASKLGVTVHPSWDYADIDAAVAEREAMQMSTEHLTDWADERDAKIASELDRMPFIEEPVSHGVDRTAQVSGEPGTTGKAEAVRGEARPLEVAEEEVRRADTGTTGRSQGALPGTRKFTEEAGAVDASGKALPQTVMPGMERSAKQLAAGRESQGRGKIRPPAQQKPADEGIFGRPKTEGVDLFANQQKPTSAPEPKQDLLGTRAAPAEVTAPEHMEAVRDRVNTEATDEQKKAGNYEKAHVKLHGMDIAIETPKGSERSGTGKDGKKWSVTMPADYGYVKRTEGADGDQFDVYIGPKPDADKVYVVDQAHADTGKFDEHKAMLGFASRKEALETYANGFSDGKGKDRIGDVTEMSVDEFKDYLKNGDLTKPAAKERSGKEPYTFESFAQAEAKMRQGDMTAAEAMGAFERVIASEAPLKAELATFPKDRLAKMNPRNRNETKQRIVDSLYSDFLNSFNATGSYSWSPFSGKGPTEGIRAAMTKQTDAHIKEAAEKRKARAAEMVKTYTNPETLTQFDDFVRVRGKDKLTSEQLARYDELKAEAGRADQARDTERKNVIKKVETPAEMSDIIETKHTKKGHALFVVQLSERVEKETYTQLASASKRLGGYYSSYRKEGAVPGFQFTTREAAEKFRQVRDADVSKADMAKERAAEVKDNAVDRLRTMAENLKEKADESAGRDRLANTHRRASMAAGAEAQAAADKALSETMKNIADAIESGEAKNLGMVRTKVDVETLDGLLRTARYEAWKIENKADPSLTYEKMKDRAITREHVDKAVFPYPNAHVETLKNLIEAVKERSGTKMAARRLQKTLDFAVREGDWRVRATNLGDMDDLFAVATAAKDTGKGYEADAVLESFKDYKRVVNMGLREAPALRAALREFLEYRGTRAKADPLKAAERALVGIKIEGYFPTPKAIAERLVEEAGIKEGMAVLEPSAGKGNIADAIRDAEPKASLSVIEPSSSLRNILQMKGHTIVDSDFTEHEGQYDRIVMNPPFERGQDVDHVQRAYGMLKPDGRVVAIMSEHPFFANDSKSTQFRSWLESVGGSSEKLPEGSFSQGERPTGVNMRVVTIDKSDVKLQVPKKDAASDLAEKVAADHGITLRAYTRHSGDIVLDMIAVPKERRKQGVGSAVMRDLTKLADAEGRRMVLTVGLKDERWGTTSRSRLVEFYKRFGFVENTGRHKDFSISDSMYREPVVKHQVAHTFYSALTRSIEQGKTAKAHGSQWQGIIKNAPGVKKEEVEWSGINEWLAEQKGLVTKEQVADFLKQNQVEVKEVEKGSMFPTYGVFLAKEDDRWWTFNTKTGEKVADYATSEGADEAAAELNASHGGGAKYGSYTLPGGENYRELLLTLPQGDIEARARQLAAKENSAPWESLGGAGREHYLRDARKEVFKTSHFDEPNIIAHVRFDDRTGPSGEKILHVAEVQSDWHQKGRRQGYKAHSQDTSALNAEFIEANNADAALHGRYSAAFDAVDRERHGTPAHQAAVARRNELATQRTASVARLNEIQERLQAAVNGVPDAPFKSTWHELAMKRMLRYAAENGYDRLSWDTGATAADRFDLSKRLQSITYQKRGDKFALWYVDRPDGRATKMGTYAAEKLPDVVGKDVADKIVNGGGKKVGFYGADAGTMELSGLDLKVGGEGMSGFYDKILPDFMNKYAKKWSAKVEDTRLEGSGLPEGYQWLQDDNGRWRIKNGRNDVAGQSFKTQDEALAYLEDAGQNVIPGASIHSLPITPAMRESVMGGQPLFNKPPKGWDSVETSSEKMPMTVAEMRSAKYTARPLGDLSEKEKALVDEVNATLQRLAPGAKKLGFRALRANDQRISGLASNAHNLIVWSLESSDVVGTARHESVHWMHGQGLFETGEWETLEKAAEDGGWIAKHGIPSRYPKGDKTLHLEEAIADEFGDWRRKGRKGWPAAVHKLFNRIDLLLRRVGAAVRRLFGSKASAADIFTHMESGAVGKRGVAAEKLANDVKFHAPGPGGPPRPKGVPVGSAYSASRKIWRDPTGKLFFDEHGKPTTLEAKPELKPIKGTGEEKVRGLPASIEADAIAEGMEAFGDLPEYRVLKNKDQIAKAIALRDQNYARALNIALGKERAPEGVLPEAVLMAVRNKARKDNDWETQRLLATNSHLSTEATTMGQRIQMLGVRDLADPVSAMKAIQSAREAMVKKRGIDAAKETEKMVAEARAEVKKTAKASKRPTWEAFMQELTCKDD